MLLQYLIVSPASYEITECKQRTNHSIAIVAESPYLRHRVEPSAVKAKIVITVYLVCGHSQLFGRAKSDTANNGKYRE